jgi:hypothetical protein
MQILSIFGANVVAISALNTKVYKICELCKAIFFRILQHLETKLCNFTNFSMLILAVVIYLHLLA